VSEGDAACRAGPRRCGRDAVLLVGLAILGAACSSAPIGPTYTQAELKTICERQRGMWHPDDLMGGYCEYRAG